MVNSKIYVYVLSTVIILGLSSTFFENAHAGVDMTFQKGDVFVGVGAGKISIFHPDGTFVRTLDTTSGSSETTGMCFDENGNLRTTSWTANSMTLFDDMGNILTHPWAGPFDLHPESCSVDSSGNIYVGQADGNRDILKFSPDGTLLDSYNVATSSRGSDWIDLASDQCTMYYTSEGTQIYRYDVCTDTQLSNFADGLSGDNCFALRILSDDQVLVACRDRVHLLNENGVVSKTYLGGTTFNPNPTFLFAMNLDPDGTSFWTLNYQDGRVYHVDIETGNQLGTFIAPRLGSSTAGLAVFGELTAALPPEPNPITEVHCEVEEEETSIELLYESDDLTGLTFETDASCAIHRGDAEPEIKDAIINVTKNIPDFDIPEGNQVLLDGWESETYLDEDPPNWDVAMDNLSVVQRENSDPSVFYGTFNSINTQFTGKISVADDDDNDFVGFVLGFQPGDTTNANAEYLLVDWKMGDQAPAVDGLAVSRVTGIPNEDDFWEHTNGVEELARGINFGSTGWQYDTEYEFSFVFTENNLKVYVDGVLEIDIDGVFSDGRIGFYNYSQSMVTYSGFNVSPVFDETGTFTINFLDESPPITISEVGTIIVDPESPTFTIDGKITGSDILPQCGELSFVASVDDEYEYSFVDTGSIWLMECPDEQVGKKKNGGDNNWDTRPTFGVNHEDRKAQIVENGFRFNNEQFTITDNFWTPFEEREIEIGTTNTFAAKVYADKGLWIQEFLFGIPVVGEGHLAELNVEVWYDRDGNIDDVKVVQKSDVIDAETISVSHEKAKCLPIDSEPICDTTTVSMTFLEPLKDKVMAIGAIDWERRSERTNLNEGFGISGESLNPMASKMIPSNIRNEGLLQVTQVAKYSPYWVADNGRVFEMNSFGSFIEINQKFERFQDSGNAFTRIHSGFGQIVDYEKNRATQVFDATKLISELPNSFGYHIEMKDRITDEMKQDMQMQEQIAKGVLDEMDKQNRYY